MRYAVRYMGTSFLIDRRSLLINSLLVLALAMICAGAMMLGSYPLSLPEVWAGLWGQASIAGTVEEMIIRDQRLPRVLAAIGVGAIFGIAGSLFQVMLRNPLASPDVIGFSAGSTCGAVLSVVLTGSTGLIIPGAIGGGLATAVLVIGLSFERGGGLRFNPFRLVLIGIGISLTITALSDLLMSKTNERLAADMTQWLTGTLNARNWQDVTLIWGTLALACPLTIWLSHPLSRLSFSDDLASGLGIALSPVRLSITVLGVVMVALAVSVAGPLPFVAFVAGPIARSIMGRGTPALGTAALIGAIVTLLADTAARAIPYFHFPTGVFTALIGAPVLMWLLVAFIRKGKL